MPAAATESRPSAPEGALCAVHPDAPASLVCERCGRFACVACVADVGPAGDAGRTCPECRAKMPAPLWERASWGWALAWVTATLVGAAVALVVVGALDERVSAAGFSHVLFELVSALHVLVVCLVFSAAQALALSRVRRQTWHWLGATALPLAATIVAMALADPSFGLGETSQRFVISGLAVLPPTLAQWLLVRRWVQRAWLWIPGCLLSLVGGVGAASAMRGSMYWWRFEAPSSPSGPFVLLVTALLPYALVQALLLKRLRRKASSRAAR